MTPESETTYVCVFAGNKLPLFRLLYNTSVKLDAFRTRGMYLDIISMYARSNMAVEMHLRRSLVNIYHHFGEICFFHLQGKIRMDAEDDI
jgi:hypothetical protein